MKECKLCGTIENTNWYSDNGCDIEGQPVICEFCYLNLRKIKKELE